MTTRDCLGLHLNEHLQKTTIVEKQKEGNIDEKSSGYNLLWLNSLNQIITKIKKI